MQKDIAINRDIFFALQKSMFLFDKSAESVLRKQKRITLAQFHVLVTVCSIGTASQQVVAEIIQNTQASVSRQVAILLRKKLITRTQNSHNKREYHLACTPYGVAEVKYAMGVLDLHFEDIFSILTRDQKKDIISSLKSLTLGVKKSQGIDKDVFHRMDACGKIMKDNLKKL